jgi:hypothetical protein
MTCICSSIKWHGLVCACLVIPCPTVRWPSRPRRARGFHSPARCSACDLEEGVAGITPDAALVCIGNPYGGPYTTVENECSALL